MNKRFVTLLILVLGVLTIISWGNYFAETGSFQIFQEPKEDVTIAIAGDVMFTRKMPPVLEAVSSPFKNVENVTKNADLLLMNFENPITTSDIAYKGDVALKAHPAYTKLAKANLNTILALANNHIFDYGEIGLNDTIKYIKENGMKSIGAGNNKEEATKPIVEEINGRKIVILNYMDQDNFKEYSQSEMPQATSASNGTGASGSNSGYAAIDWDIVKKDIDANKQGADLVIVYLHYGNEYSRSPNNHQKEISKKFIDYGADIVVGSHTHVTQGVEVYKNKPIFYGLGNFVFDQSNVNTHLAMFLELDLVNDTCEVTVHPIYINNYLPEFMSPGDGKTLLNGLSPKDSELKISDNGKAKLTFQLGDSTE